MRIFATWHVALAQVQQLKEELEATHAHYQKLLENVAGPSWRSNPGPVERAPGGSDFGGAAAGAGAGGPGEMDAFAAALSGLGRAGPGGAGAAGAGGGMGSGGGAGGPTMSASGLPPSDMRRQTVDGGGRRGGKSLANGLGGGVVPSASGTNARVSLVGQGRTAGWRSVTGRCGREGRARVRVCTQWLRDTCAAP